MPLPLRVYRVSEIYVRLRAIYVCAISVGNTERTELFECSFVRGWADGIWHMAYPYTLVSIPYAYNAGNTLYIKSTV